MQLVSCHKDKKIPCQRKGIVSTIEVFQKVNLQLVNSFKLLLTNLYLDNVMIIPLIHLLPLRLKNEEYYYSCAKNVTERESGHQEYD